jgi:hypothetical protein
VVCGKTGAIISEGECAVIHYTPKDNSSTIRAIDLPLLKDNAESRALVLL